MAPTTRPEGQLNLNLSTLSPIVEPMSAAGTKSPFGGSKAMGAGVSSLSNARVGAGSPSHDQSSRMFPKRTRELATPTGVSSSIWGPPTSGTSTPLFEIPESPDHDGFPDLIPLTETGLNSPARRGRAGTLPSRISPVGALSASHALTTKTSRPTPSTSPFRPNSTSAAENAFNSVASASSTPSTSILLSRLRAGSMPQKASGLSSNHAIGQSPFSSTWSSRSRAATLTSIHSADETTSPPPSGLTRDGLADGARTLDYLGLDESSSTLDNDLLSLSNQQYTGSSSILNSLGTRTANRFRSFSVNTQPKHGPGGLESTSNTVPQTGSGTMTPSAQAALEAEFEAVQERVRLHNQAVQAFALNARAARPRASTAGLVETPQRAALRRFGHSDDREMESREPDAARLSATSNTNNLAESFYDMTLSENTPLYNGHEDVASQMSRSLWIGSIPNSTTVSSLNAIFAGYGAIESTRVLTHKNCGFVNYENISDAVHARQHLNGKEIFPGAGPVRIGFAKAPSNSTAAASGQNTSHHSPSLDPFGGKQTTHEPAPNGMAMHNIEHRDRPQNTASVAALTDLKSEILHIVTEFGASKNEMSAISFNIDSAAAYHSLKSDIPPVSEPTGSRAFDAPRLRDIRKRIENGACPTDEIELIALEMLPEIAELSSDYLGNTVVQKLFEFCSEPLKEQMLSHIAPHLAEIGVHKNGTWAAQKIIEVCKSETQITMIVDNLRPFTVPLFLDQYGNYVLQCCLKFGSPYNDFIFETMLAQLWEVAQGRFGARAMRACLESHHATKSQQRLLAAAITLHAVKLATNTNGALLLTWLLDTCTFPKRRTVLAPRLLPNLVQLCTHKVAYLTVLKVVNQRNEPDAREQIVRALFFGTNDTTLEHILSDQTSGLTLVFKILTNPFLDDATRPEIMQKIAMILEQIKAQPNQGYKRLMDEVGLASRQAQQSIQSYGTHVHPVSKISQNPAASAYGNFGVPSQVYDNSGALNRLASNEPFGYSYSVPGFQNQQAGYNNMSYQQMTPQTHYNGFAQSRGNNGFTNNQFNGYATPPPSIDAIRGVPNTGSPMGYATQMSPLMGGSGFPPHAYGQPALSGNMYGYSNGSAQAQGYYFNSPVQPVHAGARGRRR